MARRAPLALALCALCAAAAPLAAQQTPADEAAPLVRRQAISFQPIHSIFQWYSVEYERAIGRTSTLAVSASHFGLGDVDYFSGDVKWRYYPSGNPLRGFSFGVVAGPSLLDEDFDDGCEDDCDDGEFQAIGIGFEVGHSHVSGADRRFYWGYGIGAKRLFPFDDNDLDDSDLAVPTLRLSVGYAF